MGRAQRMVALLAAAGAAAGPLFAQCAMCYQNNAAQSARAIQAMNLGILTLVVPLVAIAGGISWAVYRNRD
jgi:hypothetical protein